jgi:hypothetical protein
MNPRHNDPKRFRKSAQNGVQILAVPSERFTSKIAEQQNVVRAIPFASVHFENGLKLISLVYGTTLEYEIMYFARRCYFFPTSIFPLVTLLTGICGRYLK